MHTIYEIKVTNKHDDDDFMTTEYITQDETKTVNEVLETILKAINYQHDFEFEHCGNFVFNCDK